MTRTPTYWLVLATGFRDPQVQMLRHELVSDPEIDEPWLGKTREVPAAFSFEEALGHLVLDIVQLFHLQVETDAA